jgi:tetratricopeptide (TPR) repeat protein
MQFRELTDRYQLQKILRSTRFGTVLRGTDLQSGQTVAAKMITVGPSPGLAAAAPDFEKLAALLAGLRHPNLPVVLDSGFSPDGSAFFVLELLEGRSLDLLSGLPPARVLKIVGQALSGVEVLAAKGGAHLNLSPDNLFIAATPAGEQVKLLGLGTAIFRPRGAAAVTGIAAENARFLAPEMTAGAAGVMGALADWRADLYSLALTACSALGATVGLGNSPVVQMPLSVSFELESDEALRQVLERCLRQQPAERATPREFREALLQALGGPAGHQAPVRPATLVSTPAPQPTVATPPQPPQPFHVPEPPPAPLAPAPSNVTTFPTPPPMPAVAPALVFPAVPAALEAVDLPGTVLPAGALPPLDMPPLDSAPSPEGDVLGSVDDEVLNALLSVPAPPPRQPKPGAGGSGANVVPFLKRKPGAAPPAAAIPGQPAPAGPARWFHQPVVLGAVAGVAVLALIAAIAGAVWYVRHPKVAEVPPPPVSTFHPKVFTQAPVAQVAEATMALAQGDDLKARRILRAIPFGEKGLLPPAGCRQLDAVEETLARIALERLPADLENGLKSGDLEVLRTAVEAGGGQTAGVVPELQASFGRAKEIVDLYARALAASAQGNRVLALERFADLHSRLPKMSDPEDLRGKAAAALEAEADGLVKEAKYDDAIARLEPVQRTWPDRPGLKERVAKIRADQQNESRQEALLAALPNVERHRKPADGLEALSGVEPTPHLAARFAEARKRLEEQLAQLDKEPPKLDLRDGFVLDYARGTVVELSFRATDDYEVKSVKLLARPQGGKMRELPLEKTRTGYYTVKIPPAFHQNETVELYVVATDSSGHESYLGSRDKPLQIKRRQGFKF